MPKTVFYARVSTRDQNLDPQLAAAKQLGVSTKHLFVERASGARHDRPELAKALAACERGDTFAAYKLDRVGRSVPHLAKLIEDLETRGVHFRTVEGEINTSGSAGRMVLHMLAAVAQFERDLILERTRAGLAVAVRNGKRLGPPSKWQPGMVRRARELMDKDGLNANEAARVLGVSRRTLFRGLKQAREHDELIGGQ
jgi:DNA invertase Pin-like site-specific DNA recombinase